MTLLLHKGCLCMDYSTYLDAFADATATLYSACRAYQASFGPQELLLIAACH